MNDQRASVEARMIREEQQQITRQLHTVKHETRALWGLMLAVLAVNAGIVMTLIVHIILSKG